MRDSVISGFIVIPYNFEALLVGGQGKAAVAPIQVIVSGGEPNTANFIRGYSQGVIANWQQTRTPGGVIQKQPLDVAPRYWFNPAAKSRWYLVPGSITIVMTLPSSICSCIIFRWVSSSSVGSESSSVLISAHASSTKSIALRIFVSQSIIRSDSFRRWQAAACRLANCNKRNKAL